MIAINTSELVTQVVITFLCSECCMTHYQLYSRYVYMYFFLGSNILSKSYHDSGIVESLRIKATIHQVTTMLATSTNALFPGYNHLLTAGTDDPTL